MNNNIPHATTSILQLRNADWSKLRNDVTDRIDYLEEVVRGLEPDPLSDKIATDLIAPALYSLGSFVCSVEIEEPLPASIQRRATNACQRLWVQQAPLDGLTGRQAQRLRTSGGSRHRNRSHARPQQRAL